MKNIRFEINFNHALRIFLLFFAVNAAWCPSSFAVRQTVAPGDATIDVDGITNGVDITNAVAIQTLTVLNGNDIFTANSSGGAVVDSTLKAVTTTTDNQDIILFNGSSNVYGQLSGGAGIKIFDQVNATGGSGTTVNLYGDVHARIMGVAAGTVNFNSGTGTNAVAVTFTGDGTVGVGPNTTVTGALNPAGAQTGTLSLDSGSQWTGAVGAASGLRSINVVGGNNTAGVTAGITGAVDTYSFSLGTNTLNISGALTVENPGPNTFNTTLASPMLYGHIIEVGGTTSLPASLGVNVLVPSTAYLPIGTTFTILDSAGGAGSSIVSVTVQNPTNPLYTFIGDPSTTVGGDVTIKVTGIPLTSVVNPVVAPLQQIPNNSVLPSINALTDPVDVQNAVAQLNPSTPALAAPLTTFQTTREYQNLWLSRVDMCSTVGRKEETSSGISTGNLTENELARDGFWIKGFGNFGEQKARGAMTAYDTQTYGGMLAYDKLLSEKTRGGLGIGYAQSALDGKTFDANMDTDNYQATLYIGHENGPWFINGSGSVGWNDYTSSRHIVFPGVNRTADADYSGQEYTAFAITGRHFAIEKFTLTPLASIQYTRVNVDSYTETGAGDVNLSVNSQGYNFVESGLGAKLERDFAFRGGIYVPEVHSKWFHELSNPTAASTSTFTSGGSEFTTRGANTSDNTYNVGAGVTLLPFACGSKTWSVEAVYDYNWTTEGYSANQATLRLTNRF